MTIYTVAEIRKNMRIALDMAETTPIFIKRHDKIFMLRLTPYEKEPVVEFDPKATWLETDEVSSNVRPDIGIDPAQLGGDYSVDIDLKNSRPLTPEEKEDKVELENKLKSFAADKKYNFCPKGHAIPDGRSKCMGKGCKYA